MRGLEHLRAREVRSQCKECGGSSICEHGKQRSQCKECGGSQVCEHGRSGETDTSARSAGAQGHLRARSAGGGGAKECGGSDICEHGRERLQGAVQGVRGLSGLRAREAAILLQGVRGLGHLRAREGAKPVQGVRGLSDLRHHLRICEHCVWGLSSASTGGSDTSARSAGALRSASTGGTEASARRVGPGASARTGGTAAQAVAPLATSRLRRMIPECDTIASLVSRLRHRTSSRALAALAALTAR